MAVFEIDRKLTETEAAQYLGGFRPQTLAKMRCQGRGPKFLKLGKNIRYAQSELDRYLSAATCSNTAQAMAVA